MKAIYWKSLFIGMLLLVSTKNYAQEDYGNALNAFLTLGGSPAIGGYYEFQVIESLTVAPEFRYYFVDGGDNYTAIGARANYYFDTLLNLPEPWDIWAGANAGWFVNYTDTFGLNLHGGVGYKITEQFEVIFEFGGGRALTTGFGLGIHF